MILPGANLLNMALSVIGKQTITYRQNTGRTTGGNGQLVPTYAADVTIKGSVQPVPRNLYQQMGLNFQSSYFWIYVPNTAINDVTRNLSGDLFLWNSGKYQAMSKTDWKALDGWTAVLCVQVP